jgi:hypothetical protein
MYAQLPSSAHTSEYTAPPCPPFPYAVGLSGWGWRGRLTKPRLWEPVVEGTTSHRLTTERSRSCQRKDGAILPPNGR